MAIRMCRRQNPFGHTCSPLIRSPITTGQGAGVAPPLGVAVGVGVGVAGVAVGVGVTVAVAVFVAVAVGVAVWVAVAVLVAVAVAVAVCVAVAVGVAVLVAVAVAVGVAPPSSGIDMPTYASEVPIVACAAGAVFVTVIGYAYMPKPMEELFGKLNTELKGLKNEKIPLAVDVHNTVNKLSFKFTTCDGATAELPVPLSTDELPSS